MEKLKIKPILIWVGSIAIIWPFIYGQEKLSCLLSPQSCSEAEPIAFYLIVASLITGSLLVFFGFLSAKKMSTARIALILTLAVILSAITVFAYILDSIHVVW